MTAALPLVQAGFGTPDRQNRWSIAFRWLLAIPHVLVLLVLGIATEVLVVIGWFAALVMGRLPQPIAEFVSGVLTYQLRVYAYLWLLTDQYPPFGWNPNYVVNLSIPCTRVRRLAVLFRAFLLVPAFIVQAAVGYGMGVVAIVIWVIALVSGRMPTSLFGAVAAVLRYQSRVAAYATMLTAKYPGELFGDQPLGLPSPGQYASPTTAAPVSTTFPPPVPPYPHAPAVPAGTPPPPTEWAPAPAFTESAQPSPAQPTWSGTPVEPPSFAPKTARLVLSKAARRILVLFIVIGVLAYGAETAVVAAVSRSNLAVALDVQGAYQQLAGDISADASQLQGCGDTMLSCNEAYQSQLATAFSSFATAVTDIAFPADAQADAQSLDETTAQLITALKDLSVAPSLSAYQALLPHAQQLGNQFDSDYNDLQATLVR